MKRKLVGLLALMALIWISCKDDITELLQFPTVTLTSPVDDSNGVDVTPLFQWEASDPDGRPLSYDFYIGPDSSQLVLQAGNLSSPEYKLNDFSLLKENIYYWQVIVNNGEERVKSDMWSFRSIPAPESPSLVGPLKNSFIRDQLTFEWNPIAAGEGETIYYEVFFGDDKNSLEKIASVDGVTSFTYDPSSLEIGKVYYWLVKASDLINASASEVFAFKKLMVGAPDEPMMVTPMNKDGLYDATASLSWTEVPDPESDAVTYDIYMDNVYPPTTLVAQDLNDANFTTPSLEANKPYYWQVVAKDASNNYTNSAISSFTKLGVGAPGAPAIADFEVDGMLSLDELIKWDAVAEPDGQQVTYDVYLGDAYPPVNKLASDLTETEFRILNADLSCDLTNVKTFYCMVVAKDIDGNESPSVPAMFEPQMTGNLTDVRADESITYPWVRLGTQIWLSQNLRTKKFTDGASITDISGKTFTVNEDAKYYAAHPPVDGFPENWNDVNGLVYTWYTIMDPLMAPKGWHVPDYEECGVMMSYTNVNYKWNGNTGDEQVNDILNTEWHGGTDIYGLNLLTAGFRYNNTNSDEKTWREGFRFNLEQARFEMWMYGGTDFSLLELYGGSGAKSRPFPYNGGQMFGIRLVKNN